MRPDQVKLIAKRLGVTEQDVIDMNRRLGGDASLNAPIHEDGDSGEWQDWLVDESPDQETTLAAHDEFDYRRKVLSDALGVLNERERRIYRACAPARELRGAPAGRARALRPRPRVAPARSAGPRRRLCRCQLRHPR